jgi:hypothetical protein
MECFSDDWSAHWNIWFDSQSSIHFSHSLFLADRFFLVFVLFFPESSLLALELCSKKRTHFRMCDFDNDHSVIIGSKIDSCLIERLLINISIKWSSLQSIPFQHFCFYADNLECDDHLSETRSVFRAKESENDKWWLWLGNEVVPQNSGISGWPLSSWMFSLCSVP